MPNLQRLGTVYQLNMEAQLYLTKPKVSVKEALHHWVKNEMPMCLSRCSSLPRKIRFSLDKPVKDLPAKALNLFYMAHEKCIIGNEPRFR